MQCARRKPRCVPGLAALAALALVMCAAAAGAQPQPEPQQGEPGDTPDSADAEDTGDAEDTAEGEDAEGEDAVDATDQTAEAEPEEEYVEEPAPSGPRVDPALLTVAQQRGAGVYRRSCESCHGRLGNGQGPAARFLRVAPRDFTTGVYKWRSTPSGELPSDADLMRTVRYGAPGTSMPAWGAHLSLADIWSVVQYIKTFSPRFAEEGPPMRLRMPESVPGFDDETRQRGRMMYVLLQCWTCHGMGGTGDGPAADTLVDDNGAPIVAYNFTQGQMRSGTRPIDVYRTFTSGVNGTPMPSYDEAIVVGRDGYEDLSTFEPVLSAAELQRLATFVQAMPTTEELWSMSERQRLDWGTARRWELVAYVLSLSGGGRAAHYLFSDPYTTR